MRFKGSNMGLVISVSLAAVAAAAATPAYAQERSYRFNIPPQDMGSALRAFALASRQQVTFDARMVRGKRSPGLVGSHSAIEALNILVAGSGLSVERGRSGIFIIRSAAIAIPVGATMTGGRTAPVDPGSSAADAGSTPDIVVTAQKRSESAQKVPITLTAFTGADLDKRGIADIRDVARFTPGFNAAQFSNDKPIFAIRGAENTFSAAGATKPVGIFIDEIYIPRFSASNFSLYDAQNVTILKGPQGTLFGRNVTAGAILVTTREPSLTQIAANARVGIGNYNLREAAAYLSVPFSDRLAGSVSLNREIHDGYGRDILNGRQEDNDNSWAVRGQLLFKPASSFKLRLSGDYSHDQNNGRALSSLTLSDADRRTSQLGVPQTFDVTIAGASARMEFGDGPVKLTSVTGYRYSNSFEIFSRSGLSYLALPNSFQEIGEERERDRAFSQEGRISYEDRNISLITGVFFFSEDSYRGFHKYRLAAQTGAITLDNFYDQDVKTTSVAPFADLTWHVTDRFDLIGGIRYTYEKKDARETLTNQTAPAAGFSALDGNGWSQVTYRAVASYRANNDITLYASYATGFTAGGYNTEADQVSAFRTFFNPETSENLEAGIKTRFLDGRGRFNIAAFWTKYKDKQEFVFNNLTFIGNIINAAQARARGIESDISFSPVKALSIGGTFAYLDAKYLKFDIPGAASATGNPMGNSPRFTYSAYADLDQPVGPVRLLGGISFTHKDKYNPSATLPTPIGATNLVNAQIGIADPADHWRLMVWARNLTNQQYPLIISNYSVNAEWLAPPRTYGVRISYKY